MSIRLAEFTGLPLYILDILQFRDGRYRPREAGGGKLSADEFTLLHRELLSRSEWIIDGYGNLSATWERISEADTLVYIDLPVMTHYWGVTKRFVNGCFRNPKGWPENSPIRKSTLDSCRVIWRCHRFLTPKYRERVADEASFKQVHHLTSREAITAFLDEVKVSGGISRS